MGNRKVNNFYKPNHGSKNSKHATFKTVVSKTKSINVL